MNTEELQDMELRIIEAAKLVFVRKGYEATTMSDVASEVGISRTAMHYYFRTKELLFEAIFGQLIRILLPNIEAIMNEPTSCLEKIPRIVEQYVALVQANPSFPIFVINEFNRDPEHLYRTFMKDPSRIGPLIRFRQQLEDEMAQGIVKRMPLVYIASTLMGLIVFPMLARNPLTTLFFARDKERFTAFIDERRTFVSDLLVNMLTPQPE